MIEDIIKNFKVQGTLVKIEKNNVGNINSTFIASFENRYGIIEKILVQKVNTYVYKNPENVMDNIYNVTRYIKKRLTELGDTNHKTLEMIETVDDKIMCEVETKEGKEYYRAFKFIEDSISYDYSTDKKIVYNTGKAFGNFQYLLNKYPITTLNETIPDFHNTKKRFENFLKSIEKNNKNRVETVKDEIKFITDRKPLYGYICDKLGSSIPLRVTHNDTKVNNVMMNKFTGEYLCVIDLDTVMPGSLLYDYGDGIRSTASISSEDELNKDNIGLNLDLFKSYTDGFLSEMLPYITEEELNLMGDSILIITLELAMRFLDDYINGDKYFKIKYPKHNLDRARNQIELAKDIETKLFEINSYIENNYKKQNIQTQFVKN